MTDLETVAAQLRKTATDHDRNGAWPTEELHWLESAGAMRWMIPERWGGAGLDTASILHNYRTIASGSVALALVLTQRDGACDLIARADCDELPERYLPPLARGQDFTSIGISQITTSRGSAGAKLRATPAGDGFRLDGFMPWVSGAPACDHIVTAALLDDGRPLVACVHGDQPGVAVDPPLELLALQASHTARVRCDRVHVPPEQIVRWPRPDALAGRAPVKPLTVSAVGMGLADALVREIDALRPRLTPELAEAVVPLLALHKRIASAFVAAAAAADTAPSPRADTSQAQPDAAQLRVRVNDLLTRLAVVLMNLSKGSGFVRGHPAERLVREAMFFQVWSSPPSVQADTIAALTGPSPA